MSLDKAYFNAIRLDTYRRKFYSVDAVDRLLVDIRAQADALNRELDTARRNLAEEQQTGITLKEENRDLLSKGQTLSQEIVSLREDLKAAEAVVVDKEALRAEVLAETGAEAEQILAGANAEAERIVAEARAEAEAVQTEAENEAKTLRDSAAAEKDKLLRRVRMQCENAAVALEEAFSTAREFHSESISRIDTAWKQLLRSLPDAEGDEETPPDLSAKINRIVQELEDLEQI